MTTPFHLRPTWAPALLAVLFWAGPALSSPVVKLHSRICGGLADQSTGSGLVVSDLSGLLVLTSEHVAVVGTSICTTAQTDSGSFVDLTLLASDYSNGLALYRIQSKTGNPQNPPLDNIELSRFQLNTEALTNLHQSLNAITAGFPAASDRLLLDRGASLLSVSRRSPFATVDQVLEIKALHAEYGMSGGGLFGTDGMLLGILTHQRLQTQAGTLSTPSSESGEVLVAIPASKALTWINDILAGQKPVWTRDALSQIHAAPDVIEAARTPGLLLQSHPLRGTQNHHLGGGDGAGIGGSLEAQDAIQIELNVQDVVRLSTLRENSQLAWLHSLLPVFKTRDHLLIEEVIQWDVKTGKMSTQRPRSLGEFLRLAAAPGTTLLFAQATEIKPLPGELAEGLHLLQQSGDLEQISASESLAALFQLHQERPEVVVPASVAQELADSPGLNSLAIADFDAAIALKTALLKLSTGQLRF